MQQQIYISKKEVVINLFTPRIVVALWMIGFAGFLVIQTIMQRRFAENSYWDANNGWQNEIANWNAGMFFVILGVLRSQKNVAKHALFGLFILSASFGVNHGVALFHSQGNLSNWMGFSLNMFGVIVYFGYQLRRP